MQLGKLLIIPVALFGLKQLQELEKSETKAPKTPATPLIPSVAATPTGFLSGVTDLTGLFTPPTVPQLKRVADPFFSDKPLVREPVRERTGEVSVYRQEIRDIPLFPVGPITGLAQSFKLDFTGLEL